MIKQKTITIDCEESFADFSRLSEGKWMKIHLKAKGENHEFLCMIPLSDFREMITELHLNV